MASLAWRLFTNYKSLWVCTLINKYGTRTSQTSSSFIWRNILNGGKLCSKGMAWSPSSRKTIDFWNFSWILNTPSLRTLIQGLLNYNENSIKLSNIWNKDIWNWGGQSMVILDEIMTKANNITLRDNTCDTPYWAIHSNDIFTIKSVRDLLNSSNDTYYHIHWIWSLNTLNKIKLFLWLCSHNRLPTNSHLHHLGIITNPSCPICHNAIDTITHVFLECHLVKNSG